MRFVVLLFGLPAVFLTVLIGVVFILFEAVLDALSNQKIEVPEFLLDSPTGASHGDTGIFLLIAGVYGLVGTILGFLRCGWQGALLILIPVICTSIMNWYTAIFTGPLALVGLLCFFVFPLPIAASEAKGEED
jgi:hypothetical protein